MGISKQIEQIIVKSSWIRKMFEEGARLKAIHGAANVFDFSLGNPNLEPPESFQRVLEQVISEKRAGSHGYMANTGYPETRKAIADYLAAEQAIAYEAEDIVMTCGAAGGLNIILKSILDPGDEVLTPTPHFVEYGFYVANHGGLLKTVPSTSEFQLDIAAFEEAICERTKAVLINSPNNPTGQVYDASSLGALGDLLRQKSERYGRTIFLIADEPYRKIVYDGIKVPSVASVYGESILTTSYSKDLSIPGERIGFVAVHPDSAHRKQLGSALALTNRILGFVNAPALMQRVVAGLQGECTDVAAYARKRRLLCDGLARVGYAFVKPAGTFYLFPKSPISDDVAFVRALQEERILVVPGSGFGGPGYFRIAFCVSDETIVNALPGFERVMRRFKTNAA